MVPLGYLARERRKGLEFLLVVSGGILCASSQRGQRCSEPKTHYKSGTYYKIFNVWCAKRAPLHTKFQSDRMVAQPIHSAKFHRVSIPPVRRLCLFADQNTAVALDLTPPELHPTLLKQPTREKMWHKLCISKSIKPLIKKTHPPL